MLLTSIFSLKKPQTSDAPSALRTAISDNADNLETLLDRRGKCIVATSQSRTNVAYGLLTTPDQVAGVVLPTDGLILVGYQATWQESVSGAAKAALFLGANQLVAAVADVAAPSTSPPEGTMNTGSAGSTVARDTILTSHPGGLRSGDPDQAPASPYSGDVTTGQTLGFYTTGGTVGDYFGGFCPIFAAAGTYTVSVQFKSTSGSVTVKNRKMWVRALPFG